MSKPTAARWALAALDARWTALIERAIDGRLAPQSEILADDASETMAFIRYMLER